MRRAELRLESFLAESRGRWVTMSEIKRTCALDWDEAEHVWLVALPRLTDAGLLRTRPRRGRSAREFGATPRMVAAVAELQWRRAGSAVAALS